MSASLLWERMTMRLNAKYVKAGFTLDVLILHRCHTGYEVLAAHILGTIHRY